MNKSIRILLQLCARLSYIVMLLAAVLSLPELLVFLLLGGHALMEREAHLSRWVYMICTSALPLASACFYFRWPWGPFLVCWLAIAVQLLHGEPFPLGDPPQMAFLLAAHIGLVSYLILKRSGHWPLKTHKEVAVSR